MDTEDGEVYDWFVIRQGEVYEAIRAATELDAIFSLEKHVEERDWEEAFLVRLIAAYYPKEHKEN